MKQNGHSSLGEIQKHDQGSDVLKADDELGFDQFHETQKALAELTEKEMQIQQQRFYQQQQQWREREEKNRVHHQQNSVNLGLHHIGHLAHLQQQDLQNLHVLQEPHKLLSRLPHNILQQQNGGNQSPVQGSVTVASLGQWSKLPPPGFPSSTPSHINFFGLRIPKPVPASNALTDLLMSTGSKILPFMSHSSGVLFTGQQLSRTPHIQIKIKF